MAVWRKPIGQAPSAGRKNGVDVSKGDCMNAGFHPGPADFPLSPKKTGRSPYPCPVRSVRRPWSAQARPDRKRSRSSRGWPGSCVSCGVSASWPGFAPPRSIAAVFRIASLGKGSPEMSTAGIGVAVASMVTRSPAGAVVGSAIARADRVIPHSIRQFGRTQAAFNKCRAAGPGTGRHHRRG